jgi:hypothetical protein
MMFSPSHCLILAFPDALAADEPFDCADCAPRSEKLQIFRAATLDDGRVFDRQE